ncbi:site-specific integrase [Segetibacter sp. 3557_3]|uniref:site-specific integrase n=1 Tax=Segetibacter sp. 3557_3 TaxID=2547429 RepID=UPI00105840F9|nr:site-specific integrase [Segetibacter sp. 3557_3]TDH18481.1 site-specific integrase [Segetibacter sp. 3557_3]
MKNNNTFGVHFILRHNRELNGKVPIYLRITVNKTRVELALKRYMQASDWNDVKGCAKPKREEFIFLNTYLEELRSKLVIYYQQLTLREDRVTAADIKDAYLGRYKEKAERTLLWLVGEHNLIMEKVLAKGSIKNYYTTERYLKKFLKERYRGDILLSKLSYSFLTAFEHYIRTTPLKLNDPCTNNGTMKHLERVKKMITWAVNNQWIENAPFDTYKLKYKTAQREALSPEEFQRIENAEFENTTMQKVRELFLFSCYTGLSYVDVMDLKPTDIITGVDGARWLKIYRAKTNIAVDVPLLKPALMLMQQLTSFDGSNPCGTVFPYITNQEVNRTLKMIAEVCGIKRNLTFHLARHTFATTITLCNGVPIETISKMLGHAKLTTTMVYARVVNTKVGMDMALLQCKLDRKS